MPSFATLSASLPPDILYLIAGFVDPEVQDHPDSRRSFLNLTGVCRHWRSAFLSCPSFWTRIQIPECSVWYLEEILTRSAEYPLKVTVHYYPEYPASTITQHSNVLLPHLHRIQSLVIYQRYGYDEPIPDSIFSLISKPVPILEILRYEFRRVPFSYLDFAAQGSIPENLFADHAPKLKEFLISRVKLYHNLPVFKTITRLSLQNAYGLTHYRLLDILESVSSNLEFLEISSPASFMLPFDGSDQNNRLAISLSSLRTLVLRVGLQVLLLILSRTNIPYDTDWKIDFAELIAKVSLDLTPFVSFLAKARKGPYVLVTVYEEYLNIEFKQTRSGPYSTALGLKMEVDFEDEELMRLEPILASLELSNVLSCELVCIERFPPWMETYDEMFQPLFFFLNRTETLSITCNNSNYNQLEAFVHCLRPRNAQPTFTTPCPSLKDLKVGLLTTMAGFLIQGLIARKDSGHVLTKLCVEYENHLKSHTRIKQDLMKLVPNVEMIEKATSTSNTLTHW